MTLKQRILPLIGALIVCILCSCVLYVGDNIGLSDNGDFRRILLASRMEYADDTDSQYLFKQNYVMEVDGYDFVSKVVSVWKTDTENEIYRSPHFIFRGWQESIFLCFRLPRGVFLHFLMIDRYGCAFWSFCCFCLFSATQGIFYILTPFTVNRCNIFR